MNKRCCSLILLFLLSVGAIAQDLSSFLPRENLSLASDSVESAFSSSGRKKSLVRSLILPVSLVTSGVIVEVFPPGAVFSKERIQQHVQDKMNGFSTYADNYLQYAPLAAMFGLSFAGIKSKSDLKNQVIITVKSELLVSAVVLTLKYFIHDMRPDKSSDNSMPSGHTAQAFASATLLDIEYRDTSPWISVGGYLCAAATGFLRVSNNRHWASDVLIGAAIGIASVKTVSLTHRYRWGRGQTGVLLPAIYPNGGGVVWAMKF